MDFDSLSWFETIVDLESISHAADVIHVDPSTLSRALGRIESELGVKLFDRNGHHLVLNECGRLFQTFAKRSIDDFATLRQRIGELADPGDGELRVEFLEALGPWVARDLLIPFRNLLPGVHFLLQALPLSNLLEDLIRGRTDFIVLADDPDENWLTWKALESEPLYLALTQQHALASLTDVALSDVADEPFLLSRAGSGLHKRVLELCERAGFTPKTFAEIAHLGSIRTLVASGLGISILPRTHTEIEPEQLAYVSLSDPAAHLHLGLAWLEEKEFSPTARRFQQFVTGLPALACSLH